MEVVEAKELERDCTIHIITAENQALAKRKRVMEEQVALLQEALLIGKTEWQRMKVEVQNMKKFALENTKVMNVKPFQDKGKVVAQIDNHEETSREERKGDSTEILLRGKEKQTFRLTTCKIEKSRKDKIEQHT